LDLAQPINQFLTPKSYAKLTAFFQITKGCDMADVGERPDGVFLVFLGGCKNPCDHEFSSVFYIFPDAQTGVSVLYFGPISLLDKTTIARIHMLLCAFIMVLTGNAMGISPAYANDTFPGTTIAGSSGTFTSTNVGATGETGEPATFGGGNLNTIWYSWTAPASGVFVAGTCNPTASTTTSFDTTLGAYTGAAVNALAAITTNDDTTGCNSTVNANYGSTVTFNATSGTTYRFQVDGYNNTTGTYHFHYGLVGMVVAVTDGSATEGGDTAAFTVRLTTVPTANVTVTIGTSTQCTFASSTLTFTLANWNTPQTVTATATNDAIVEGTHSCAPASITATGGSFNTATGTPPTLVVNDNDSATVTIANTTNGAEAGPVNGVMTVTQSAVSATDTVVAYSVGGTATSGSDYTALSGTATILAGATTATISIPVINDAIVEGAETAVVTLTGITSGLATLGGTLVATNTIADNDSATVSIANTTNGVETGPINGVMTVTQTAVSSTNTVLAYSVGGTATSGSDYTALSGTVTILAGATTATISIPVIDDAIVETSETVIVTLTGVTTGLATLGAGLVATNTIIDNDSATVSIANTTDGAEAGPINGVMTVTQTATSATNTVLAYSVSGTATSGSDFTALSGSVSIPSGSTTATITIPVLNDVIVEPSETVIVTLTSVTSGLATLGSPLAATNTIADNDVGTIVVVTTDNAATETAGNTGVFTVTLGLQPSATVTVTIGSSPQCNFAPTALTFTTANWNTAQTVTVTPIDDAIVEGPHTCSPASIAAANGGYTGVTGTPPTINITDNDSATVSIANTTNGAEPSTNGVMTLTQTAVSATNTVIAYSVAGTATSGSDYVALSGSVTIPAGATTATITITVIDNLVVEPFETVIVTLTSITSGLATLGAPLSATNIIADNDVASFTIAKAVNPANISTPSTLTYTITIANTGNVPLTTPVITDTLTQGGPLTLTSGPTLTSGDAAPLGTLDAGETWVYTATYAVTQGNIDNGTAISNVSTFDTAETPLSTSNTVTTTITQSPAMTVVKTANTAGPVSASDVITYTFTVKNTGNITLSNVVLSDTHNGYGTPPVPANEALFSDVAPFGDSTDGTSNNSIWSILSPGDEVRFTAPYTVVQQDVDFLQ
jgi:Calx-beta domain/Domain of unknown function DUF11